MYMQKSPNLKMPVTILQQNHQIKALYICTNISDILSYSYAGKINCMVSQKDIAPLTKAEDIFIRLSLPEGESSTVDTYRVFVSCSPLQLDSLEQLNVMDYFSSHEYQLPDLKNLILQVSNRNIMYTLLVILEQ